jgi:hypothetical protein
MDFFDFMTEDIVIDRTYNTLNHIIIVIDSPSIVARDRLVKSLQLVKKLDAG